jgi:hypothetical protein
MLDNQAKKNHEKLNTLIIRITGLCWLPAKLLGWRMFTTYRAFPTAPVFKIFDQLPPVVHTLIFAASILFMVSLFIMPKYKPVLYGLLIIELISCLLDQNRLQPWNYLYCFILLTTIINSDKQKLAIIVFTFILASTYFYSGLGKLNVGFLHTIWSNMLLHSFLKIPAATIRETWLQYCGLLIGFFELTCGVGLIFLKTRKIAATLLILMHFFILVFLGPFGLNYNRVVWPWNIAMIGFLYLIFFRYEQNPFSFKPLSIGWNKLVFIFLGILPVLNFAGWWDNYVSSGVYSGKLPQMVICIKDTSKCRDLRRFCKTGTHQFCDGNNTVNLQYWSMSETQMAPYPEIRVYKKLQHKLEMEYPEAGLSFIYFSNGQQQK